MTPITTDSGETYGVAEVPKDSRGFCKSEKGGIVYLYGQGLYNFCSFIDVEYDKWEILGEITWTKDGDIGFETNQLINGHEIIKAIPEQTGILFKNPLGDNEPLHIFSDHPEKSESKMYQALYKEWQSYEKQLLGRDKKLIVLRIKKLCHLTKIRKFIVPMITWAMLLMYSRYSLIALPKRMG